MTAEPTALDNLLDAIATIDQAQQRDAAIPIRIEPAPRYSHTPDEILYINHPEAFRIIGGI